MGAVWWWWWWRRRGAGITALALGRSECLHGDRNQAGGRKWSARSSAEVRVLIATDVASRGLDIPAIKTVVS